MSSDHPLLASFTITLYILVFQNSLKHFLLSFYVVFERVLIHYFLTNLVLEWQTS